MLICLEYHIIIVMRFEENKVYRFATKGIFYDSSGAYIALKGEEGKEYKVRALPYQEDWVEIPKTIECVVKSSDPLEFIQSKEFILRDRYPQTNVSHTFVVQGTYKDNKTGGVFYSLKDEFGLNHRLYPKENVSIEGERIELWVNGVKTKDSPQKAYLDLSIGPVQVPCYNHQNVSTAAAEGESEIKEKEGQYSEFKSSLVYPAGTAEPNIDAQTKVIMQSIAGMMNASGGKLYIGVNNDGNIRTGIEDDFEYLNSSANDRYNDYTKDDDGYLNKLSNSIGYYLGSYAKTLVSCKVKHGKNNSRYTAGARYIIIEIRQSDFWPVWVLGKALFVRTGNNTTHLFGDDISKYFWARFKNGASNVDVQIPLSPNAEPPKDDLEVIEELPPVDSVDKEKQSILDKNDQDGDMVKATFDLFEKESLYGYLYLYKGKEKDHNAEIVCANDPQPKDAYECRISLPKGYKDYNLVLCYEQGYTDWIDIESALFTGNGNPKRHIRFTWKSGRNVINAFCVRNNRKTKDLVAYVSTRNGTTFLKCNELYSLTSADPHKNLDNGGNAMLEQDSVLNYAMRVSGDKKTRLLLDDIGLIYEDRTNHKNGVDVASLLEKYRSALSSILDLYLSSKNSVQPNDQEVFDVLPTETVDVDMVEHSANDNNDYNQAWIFQDNKSFFVAYHRIEPKMQGTTNSILKSLGNIWNLKDSDACPIYVIRFRNKGLISWNRYDDIFRKVIEMQTDYLRSGNNQQLHKLSQSDLAQELNLDDSVVSRAIENISIMSTGGRFSKDDIFSSAGVGELTEVQCIDEIRKIRAAYPKATDEFIAEEFTKRTGVRIARRTVAKYRQEGDVVNSRGK